MKNMKTEYVRSTDLTSDELADGLRDGTLTYYRVDATGEEWYRRMPVIRAVPGDEGVADD
jgi:hypothetical protein